MTGVAPAGGGVRGPASRAGLVVALLVAGGAGFGLARLLPSKAGLLDALGDPAPDVARRDARVGPALERAAVESRVDRQLLLALAAVESAFDPKARSRTGAVGLLQLERATAEELAPSLGLAASSLDLDDPETSARLGARYLARLLAEFAGDETLAVAAYNAGPGTVRRWLARAADADARTVVEREGYAETRRHVERVRRFRAAYARAP